MPNIKVAVIDSGADPLSLRHAQLHHSLRIKRQSGRFGFGRCLTDPIGHGTACVELIGRLAPSALISSLAITDEHGSFEPEALIQAIEWCIEKAIHVVSISLGTTDSSQRAALERICTKANAAGLIIIAAVHNDGLVSFPAHCDATIGVSGASLVGEDEIIYRPNHPIQCVARGDRQRVRWRQGEDRMIAGSSFAAPRVTARITRLLAESTSPIVPNIHELLGRIATQVQPDATAPEQPTSTKPIGARAALYPFTKEMHSLVRFRDLLAFQIVGVADPPGRRCVGQDAGEVLRQSPMGVTISASLPNALEGADVLVLGYTGKLGDLQGRDALRDAVTHALDAKASVFSFESVDPVRYPDLHKRAREQGLSLHSPRLSMEEAKRVLRMPQAACVDRPVLGVFGTSSSQGKFTLQLALRRSLMQEGYRVAQVGTEHHAELFGLDVSFPMGYGSQVDLALQHWPDYLDRRMRRLCSESQHDLIIAGSQSGTVPYDVHDPRTLTLPSLAFLLGTKPDACILVVNATDDDDYVRATIATLESLAQTRVLSLAISDQQRSAEIRHGRSWLKTSTPNKANQQMHLERLAQTHQLPAFCIGESGDILRLTKLVVSAFCPSQSKRAA
ncbi:MAG: DUF1611 domain-containing protein [Gemmatimonadetes bacterium]|nr:DUF1611 domain-containing protein [Gemmatimonadota bacterium]